MISLTNVIPHADKPRAEWVRLAAVFDCYPNDAYFWEQDGGRAYLCSLDGNMTIYNVSADISELAEFIDVIAPQSIFTDKQTLLALNKEPIESAFVMCKNACDMGEIPSDGYNSSKVFDIFLRSGLNVPEYDYFAVDFCRRINHGFAKCFFKTDECAAFSVHSGDFALIQGIASLKKGMGSIALKAILQRNYGRDVLACCESGVRGFYEKNGFRELYETAFWVKK